MKCIFCQKSSPNVKLEDNIISCDLCNDWIIGSGDFGLVFNNDDLSKLDSVYYYCIDGTEDDIYYRLDVYFDFVEQSTTITEHYLTETRTLLKLPLLPITKEFLDSIPNKLKLWITFS